MTETEQNMFGGTDSFSGVSYRKYSKLLPDFTVPFPLTLMPNKAQSLSDAPALSSCALRKRKVSIPVAD